MELELGLALPNHTPMMIKGLDLNHSNIALDTESPKRRRFRDDEDGIEVDCHLSLLLWSGSGRNDHGRRSPKSRKLDESSENDEVEEIEGWPPVDEVDRRRRGGLAAAEQGRSSMYVKVKMEGVAIGRKIDLRLYDSYRDLINTLIDMFAKYYKIEGNKEEYTLLYQDRKGDWMLVGDVQWEFFVETVQRLEILKINRKMGFKLSSCYTIKCK